MKLYDWIDTPRFCKVKIKAILTPALAREFGFTETTHYKGDFNIYGKHIGTNLMIFAAVIPDPNSDN